MEIMDELATCITDIVFKNDLISSAEKMLQKIKPIGNNNNTFTEDAANTNAIIAFWLEYVHTVCLINNNWVSKLW